MSDTVIRFDAQVWAIKTLVDGGLQFVFAVSEDKTMQAAQLMECKRFGMLLNITAMPMLNKVKQDDAGSQMAARTKRKSSWKTVKEPGSDGNS